MPVNPRVKVFLMVIGFVLLLIGPVSYAIYREYQYRKSAAANKTQTVPVADSIKTAQ